MNCRLQLIVWQRVNTYVAINLIAALVPISALFGAVSVLNKTARRTPAIYFMETSTNKQDVRNKLRNLFSGDDKGQPLFEVCARGCRAYIEHPSSPGQKKTNNAEGNNSRVHAHCT